MNADTARPSSRRRVRVPDPRGRRSALSRVLRSLLVTVLVVAIASGAAGYLGYQAYSASGPLAASKVLEIRKGLRTPEIAGELEGAGVISNATLFTAAAYLTGARGRLKAGEYEFPAAISMRDALDIVVEGKAIVYKLSVPEGFTTTQALARVREHPVLAGDLTLSPPEGAIMPDTYVFHRGDTRDELVAGMVAAQTKLLDRLWESRAKDLPLKTKQEAVTLASIVEKETGVAEERPHVASVFVNRLRKKMRLQSDPTIIYGLADGKGKLDRPLTRKDIAEKTAYNTYRIDGLPPGPIANPGRAALEAVLNPLPSRDLYFVADGTGGHVFAVTLEKHRANVEKWREVERAHKAGQEIEDLADAKIEPDLASAEPPAPAAAPETKNEPVASTAKPQDGAKPAAEAQTAAAEPPAPIAPKPEPAPADAPAIANPVALAAIPQPRPKPPPPRKLGAVRTAADRLVPIPVAKPKRSTEAARVGAPRSSRAAPPPHH